ncbi:MAG: PBP1A family penicillin-binding protein [Bacillus sp. (in: Bacteria)]|nr:PBP1A family penicillin-binding protein [Bacillus sp. (in: firmicutes)]
MSQQYKSREERKKLQGIKRKNQKRGKKLVFRLIFMLFLLGVIGAIGGGITAAYYISQAPPLDETLLKDPIASEIYDKDGNFITRIGTEKRKYVEYDDIPKLVEDAILATEDNRFYKHHGIDLIRLGGAVIANITEGFGSEGASTLTQQVVKNSFLSDEKTIKRKIQEAWLAYQLEQNYSKEEIFEMYVNKIYMSEGIHGIATAANYYYGKELNDLKLHEAALLAGMPQAPNRYNPYNNPEAAEKRRNTVLYLMYKHGRITKEEMEAAKQIPVTEGLLSEESHVASNKYEAFIDLVIEEVEALGNYNVFSDGLKIYTTLEPEAQEFVEKMLTNDGMIPFPDDKMQAGIALIDTKTGEIRAVGGSREKDVKRGFNYAVDAKRQPGSTIKPILDYGPAIEYLQWSTYHQIVDEPYTYKDGTPIRNYDGSYQGQMTIRKALYLSRNIPALKAMQAVGLEKSREFGEKLGLHFENFYESYSIGGMGEGVSPLEMAGAYAAFGNNGFYTKPYAVKKIVLRDGETEINTTPETTVAMKDYTAYMITDMLKDVLTVGTGQKARVSGVPIAGKTGTTNYSAEERQKYNITNSKAAPDIWFVGYSTNYTAAVWTGYEKRSDPILPKDQKLAQYIFKTLMTEVSKGKDNPDFKKPSSVVEVPVEVGSNPPMLASEYTPKEEIVYELFVRGTEPTEVSKKYDKLEAPFNIQAKYHEEEHEIILTWDYEINEEEEIPVEFEVSVSLDEGPKQVLTTTKEMGLNITNPINGGVYTFYITAIRGEQRSEERSVTIQIPDKTKELFDDDEDEDEDDDEKPSKDKNQQDDSPSSPPDGENPPSDGTNDIIDSLIPNPDRQNGSPSN